MSLVRWRNKKDQAAVERAGRSEGPRTIGQEINQLFERFAEELGAPWGAPGGWAPALDVTETGDAVEVRAEIPGVDPQDLEVQVTGRLLTVSGEKRDAREEKTGTTFRAERRFGRFRRTIELPSAVEVDRVSARSEKGVLTITLPRREKARPRRVAVK